jgi:hypothetical protein
VKVDSPRSQVSSPSAFLDNAGLQDAIVAQGPEGEAHDAFGASRAGAEAFNKGLAIDRQVHLSRGDQAVAEHIGFGTVPSRSMPGKTVNVLPPILADWPPASALTRKLVGSPIRSASMSKNCSPPVS